MSGIDYLKTFPALNTVSNKLEAKHVKQFRTSNVNQTFTISILDKIFDNGQAINVENAKSICIKIINETGVSVEICTTKTKADMSFIVSGNKANVEEAKKRIVSSFKNQDKEVLVKRPAKKTIHLDVPARYRRSLIGINGDTVRELCRKFKVHIIIPSREQYNNTIKITGSFKNLEEAVQAIKALMKEFDNNQLRAREKTFIGDIHRLQENASVSD